MYLLKRIGIGELPAIKALFTGVFTQAPWHDDWSDQEQLDAYLSDLMTQGNSLTYGLYEGEALIALSMGRIKHWYTGTEYCIDELCVRTDKQGQGIGTLFLSQMEQAIRAIGLSQIFLQTDRNVPAYGFYQKNGFHELELNVSFAKRVDTPDQKTGAEQP